MSTTSHLCLNQTIAAPAGRPDRKISGSFRWGRRLLLGALAIAAGIQAMAVNRVLTIASPASIATGHTIRISVYASTNAGDGEKIGFMHAEYSVDGGATWKPICYEENMGATGTRVATFPAGAAGSRIIARARVAFRGGKDGDVDFSGKAIDWTGSWDKWQTPPARLARTTVTPE